MEAPEQFQLRPAAAPEKQQGGDQFTVDDLLDFSNDDAEEEEIDAGAAAAAAAATAGSDSSSGSSAVTTVDSCSNSFSGPDPHLPLAAELRDPYEDLAELEWLSNFVEDSFSSEDMEKMQLISGHKSSTSAATVPIPTSSSETDLTGKAQFSQPEAPVPAKARSKRSRGAPCSWASRLLVLSQNSDIEDERELVVKKVAKKEAVASSDGRRCQHCFTDKTPQWRTGPTGPKTLCNACGVRFKSGRLVPEYRPAASPTFVPSQHSNSHRKVLELRRQKELEGGQQPHFYDGDDYLIHYRIGPDFRQMI